MRNYNRISKNSNYKILIEKNYPEYKLEKFNMILAAINIVKKVDFDIWLKIFNK